MLRVGLKIAPLSEIFILQNKLMEIITDSVILTENKFGNISTKIILTNAK